MWLIFFVSVLKCFDSFEVFQQVSVLGLGRFLILGFMYLFIKKKAYYFTANSTGAAYL